MKNFGIKGFTLIELVIVISIIALLSGISVFALNNARSSGRDAKRRGDLAQIASGLELYKSDCNVYPNALPAVNSPLLGNTAPCTLPSTNIYIQAIPGDPDTARFYVYQPRPSGCTSTDSCRQFLIWASLENPPTIPSYCTGTAPLCGSTVATTCNFCITNP